MALTLTQPVIGSFDPATRDQASMARKLALAVLGAGTAAQRLTARAELLQRPDFTVEAKTTDNTAASAVIDLTAKGVTFAASTIRKIRFRSLARTGDTQFVQEWEQSVLGGTTPVLLGTPRLINAFASAAGVGKQYGLCTARATYSTDTATADAANSSLGSSLGNNSTNTITLTHPICRSSPKQIRSINNAPATATASGMRNVCGISASSTTFSLFVTDLATPTAASPAPTDLTVQFFIVPPPSVQLAMATNSVTVTAGHDATDNVYHAIQVFVGKSESAIFAVD